MVYKFSVTTTRGTFICISSFCSFMDEYDLLAREELVIQANMYEDDMLQIDAPVHPSIHSLEESIRFDMSIPKQILQDSSYITECESDINKYVVAISQDFSEEEINSWGVFSFEKFNPKWTFSFEKADVLPTIKWDDGLKTHELVYVGIPTCIHGITEHGKGLSAKDLSVMYDMPEHALIHGRIHKSEPSLILFNETEKYERFHGDVLTTNHNTTVYTLSTFRLDNVPQAIFLRNFAVRYLNTLTERALIKNT